MDLGLEQRAYKVEHNISGKLRAMGEEVGSFQARPRDVVELHSRALRNKVRGVTPSKAQAYVDEGRVMVVELMGYLASYYRDCSFGLRPIPMMDTPDTLDTPHAPDQGPATQR